MKHFIVIWNSFTTLLGAIFAVLIILMWISFFAILFGFVEQGPSDNDGAVNDFIP